MMRWRPSTVEVALPSSSGTATWKRLGEALRDAVAIGYRVVRLSTPRYDRRIENLLGPIIATGVHTQICLDPARTKRAVDTGRLPGVGTWLVAAPPEGSLDAAGASITTALGHLARCDRRRGLSIPLTSVRARDLEALLSIARTSECTRVVLRSHLGDGSRAADELERSMAYIAVRRASHDATPQIELDLIERENVARHLASSLSTSAPFTRAVPTLVIASDGRVDPLRAGITGYTIGNLDDAPLLQLLARWRTRSAARWVALHRAMITRLGRADAWPVVDWPAELASCANTVALGKYATRTVAVDAKAARRLP